jgi:hypothetical protein
MKFIKYIIAEIFWWTLAFIGLIIVNVITLYNKIKEKI